MKINLTVEMRDKIIKMIIKEEEEKDLKEEIALREQQEQAEQAELKRMEQEMKEAYDLFLADCADCEKIMEIALEKQLEIDNQNKKEKSFKIEATQNTKRVTNALISALKISVYEYYNKNSDSKAFDCQGKTFKTRKSFNQYLISQVKSSNLKELKQATTSLNFPCFNIIFN